MIATLPERLPTAAARCQRTGKAMDVILHIGAHRCANTTFQNYMQLNAERLGLDGVGFWGPRRVRDGLFRGLLPGSGPGCGTGCGTGRGTGHKAHRRALGRVRMHLAHNAAQGRKKLVVSDEHMLGSIRGNLRRGDLYGGAGERVARYFQAFDGRVSDVMVNIRSPENYWASAMGYGLARGGAVPGQAELNRLVENTRSWRDVITDVACATPGARLWVVPFETFAGRPETQLAVVTAQDAPKTHAREWLNATPRLPELRAVVGPAGADALPRGDARWQPFNAAQRAILREHYANDMKWMKAGADGLARLMEDPDKTCAGLNLPRQI